MVNNKHNKRKMGAQHLLNPRPAVLVGTVIDNKPNLFTVSWAGITSANPPTISIAVRNIRYSLQGIQQNMAFSINLPSVSFIKETNYCGTVSGSDHNKIEECNFNIFYGKLKYAPLIEECPINIECQVLQELVIGDHTVFIGEIIESYITDDCFTDDIPDINKIDPLCFCSFTENAMGYYKVGDLIETYKF